MLKVLGRQGSPLLRLKVYPTGEFSATRVREIASLVPENYAEGYEKASAFLARRCSCPGRPTSEFVAEQIPPLGLSKVPNSHKPRKARGRKGMSRYNKRLIVNSCLLLEKKYGRRHLGFLTLTLPPECANGSADAYREAKRQMLQWFQRALASRGLPCEVVGCTEVQTSRFCRTAEFALHEHWIFVGRLPSRTWALRSSEIQSAWLRILGRVYALVSGFEHSTAAVNVQRVKRSAGAYLGKYLSKGQAVIEAALDAGCEDMLPASWVTRSISMLKMYQHSILNISGEKASILSQILKDNASIFCRWSRDVNIEMESGLKVWLAFIGYVNKAGFEVIGILAD